MTKKDFFRLIIKLFGLYALIQTVFGYIPSNISYIIYEFDVSIFFWILGATLLIVAIFMFLIFKVDLIIKWLRLDKGFDNDLIDFNNFNGENIIKLSLILLGGVLIINYLPDLLQTTYLWFKREVSSRGLNSMETIISGQNTISINWGIAAINVVLGIVLLNNYAQLAKWLYRKENYKD